MLNAATPKTGSPQPRTKLVWMIAVAAIYAGLAKLVLDFFSPSGLVSIFWPGAGLALAALLIGDRRFWIAIYVGGFAGLLWAGQQPLLAALLTVCSTLEPLLGAWLLTRGAGFRTTLESPRDLFRLWYLAGLLAAGACALCGATVLFLWGVGSAGDLAHNAVSWWMGDVLGIVVVTPMILAWRDPAPVRQGRLRETVAVLVVAGLIGQVLFLELLDDSVGPIRQSYWEFLIVAWAAARLGLRGVLLTILVLTLEALDGTVRGVGVFAYGPVASQQVHLWGSTITLTLIGTALATLFAEQERTTARLQESEERYRSLFDNMSAGFAHCRMIFEGGLPVDYEFITVNPAFAVVTGLQGVVGRRMSDLVPDYYRDNRISCEIFGHVAETGEATLWEHYFAAVDRHFALTLYRPAPGEFVALIENITERKRAEALLQASEERLRLAQEAAGIGIYDYDMVSGTINWDERMRDFWGIGPDQPFSYEALVATVHPADRAGRDAAIAAALDPAGNGRYHVEYRVIGEGGDRTRHMASTGQVYFKDGKPVRLIGTVQDISERKAMELGAQERRSELESLLQEQVAAQTAAAIAHELNQPLVAISAYGEVALRVLEDGSRDPDRLTRAVKGCVDQAQRAGRTLHELLDFLHKGETEATALDLNELVREAVAIARNDGYGGFRADLELEPGLPPVLANRVQVQKVLLNLMRNGIEAMREAGLSPAPLSIAVRTAGGQDMAQVTLRDTGPGFDPERAMRAFEPFFTTKPGGIGLGLAISRALIESHGGQLWLDPKSEAGATFHFTVPFAHD